MKYPELLVAWYLKFGLGWFGCTEVRKLLPPGLSPTVSCLFNLNSHWTPLPLSYCPSVYFLPNSQNDTPKTFNAAHVPPLLQTLRISLGGKAKAHKGLRPSLAWPPPLPQPLLPLISSSKSLLVTFFRHGFSTSALLTVWAGPFFVVGGRPIHCRMFRCVPGLYSRDASSTPFLSQ